MKLPSFIEKFVYPRMKPGVPVCLLMFCFLLYCCIPEPLPVGHIPVPQPKIVVSTQIVPDRSLVVLLTKTISALDANGATDPQILLDMLAVSDATVIIRGRATTDTLLYLGNGLYGGAIIPFRNGEWYSLQVESKTLGSVTAATTVKPQIKFESVSAGLYYNGFRDTLAQISYSLKDPEMENWYMINVQEVDRANIIDNVLNPHAFTKVIEDVNFTEEIFSDEFRVFTRDYKPGDTIAVSLSNISEEYYRFMKLRIDNRYSFVEYLGEPVNYPSNIEGGYGFFNLYIPDIRIFVLEKE